MSLRDRECWGDHVHSRHWEWTGIAIRDPATGELLDPFASAKEILALIKHLFADARYASLSDSEMGFAAQMITTEYVTQGRPRLSSRDDLEIPIKGDLSDLHRLHLFKKPVDYRAQLAAQTAAKECALPGLLAGCHRGEHACRGGRPSSRKSRAY